MQFRFRNFNMPFMAPFMAPLGILLAMGIVALVFFVILPIVGLFVAGVLGIVALGLLVLLPLKLLGKVIGPRIIGTPRSGIYIGGYDAAMTGNGEIQTEVREVSEFHRIDIDGAFRVEIDCGPEDSLSITGDSNLIKWVETDIADNTLHIRPGGAGMSPSQEIEILITLPYLAEVSVGGACKLQATGIDSDNMQITVRGASKGHFSGTVQNGHMDVSGAAKLNAQELQCTELDVEVSGAGKASVYASDRLAIMGSGAGKVTCHGNPDNISQMVSGAAKVSIK